MKIKSLLLLVFTALLTAACSDDDKPTVADIQGIYEGYSIADCKYFTNSISEGEVITITENADGTANVVFESTSWGECTIPNAQLSENAGTYTLTGDGQAVMGMEDKKTTYDCSFVASIKSRTDASMQFTVPAVMGGLTIRFSTGTAPAAE